MNTFAGNGWTVVMGAIDFTLTYGSEQVYFNSLFDSFPEGKEMADLRALLVRSLGCDAAQIIERMNAFFEG